MCFSQIVPISRPLQHQSIANAGVVPQIGIYKVLSNLIYQKNLCLLTPHCAVYAAVVCIAIP